MGYSTFEADLEKDLGAIRRVWAAGLSDPRIASVLDRRIRWFYHENPGGKPRTWLVATDDGEVVGCASVQPRWVTIDGRRSKAGLLCDFGVVAAHRVLGPAIKLQDALARASLDAGFAFLYGRPNAAALPVFKRIGFELVSDDAQWVKPLRVEFKLRERLPRPLVAPTAFLANGVLALNDRRLLLGRGGFESSVGGDMPDLPEDLRDGARIALEQTTPYLAWRYGGHTTEKFECLSLFDRRTRQLRGAAVFVARADNKVITESLVYAHERAFDALVLWYSIEMRRRGHDLILVGHAGAPELGRRLRRLGFVQRPGADKLVCFVDRRQPASFREAVLRADSWNLFAGDMDI